MVPGGPPRDLFYPQTYAGEGEMTFQVYPGFTPRDYLYYIMVGPEADTTLRFSHGFPYQHDYGAGLDGTTWLQVGESGNYTVGYSGAGIMTVAVAPEDWRVYRSQDLLASYAGPFPPGWFALLLMDPESGGNSHVEVVTSFDVAVTTAVFALDSGIQFKGWLEGTPSGSLVTHVGGSDMVSIHVYNPTGDLIEGSVHIIPFTPPLSSDVVIGIIVVIGALSAVVVVLYDWWRKRAKRRLKRVDSP